MGESGSKLTTRDVFRTWWPLAASWIFMALEGPFQTIFVARLPDPKIHLAAFGSLVLPIAMLIEAPIIMMLSASTALSTDVDAYRRIHRIMHRLAAGLTLLHALLALTPLYQLLVVNVLHAPPETVGPARVGFILMIPWAWAIAYRRFNQGVLIRFGRSITVGIGTLIRLSADAVVLVLGFTVFHVPGTTLACLSVMAGVLSEAAYAGLCVRPVLRTVLPRESKAQPLSTRAFLRFYVPLSLTSLVLMGIRPMLSAAVGRMPNALDSLAVLPVINGLIFLFRSVGAAYNEVVIAHLDRPGSSAVLGSLCPVACGRHVSRARRDHGDAAGPDLVRHDLGARRLALQPRAVRALDHRPLARLRRHPELSCRESSCTARRRAASRRPSSSTSQRASSCSEPASPWGGANGAYVALASMAVGELLRTAWFFWRSREPRRALRERDRRRAATAGA